MKEQIEAKIAAWMQSAQQLQAEDTQLMQRLNEVRTAYQRYIGAIEGARALQAELDAANGEPPLAVPPLEALGGGENA